MTLTRLVYKVVAKHWKRTKRRKLLQTIFPTVHWCCTCCHHRCRHVYNGSVYDSRVYDAANQFGQNGKFMPKLNLMHTTTVCTTAAIYSMKAAVVHTAVILKRCWSSPSFSSHRRGNICIVFYAPLNIFLHFANKMLGFFWAPKSSSLKVTQQYCQTMFAFKGVLTVTFLLKEPINVVYFYQNSSALHGTHWSKSSFLAFEHIFPTQWEKRRESTKRKKKYTKNCYPHF